MKHYWVLQLQLLATSDCSLYLLSFNNNFTKLGRLIYYLQEYNERTQFGQRQPWLSCVNYAWTIPLCHSDSVITMCSIYFILKLWIFTAAVVCIALYYISLSQMFLSTCLPMLLSKFLPPFPCTLTHTHSHTHTHTHTHTALIVFGGSVTERNMVSMAFTSSRCLSTSICWTPVSSLSAAPG